MSLVYTPDRLQLPDTLQAQLHDFRRRVWMIKTVEAVAAATFGVLVAYLVLFCLDRRVGHAGWLRIGLFVDGRGRVCQYSLGSAPLGLAASPARATGPALSRKHPRVGDQLLGIIELVRNDFEQARCARSARRRSAKSPTMPSDVISATRFPTRAIGSGSGWSRCRVAALVLLPSFRPRPRTPGSDSWCRGKTPRGYTFTMLDAPS